MKKTNILKVFLASPSDVKAEREVIFALKDELDELIGKPNNIRFEFVNWEKNTYPGVGEDAQDVINKNINDDYNIFIGLFWQRFGTPTNRAESGTKEEFDRALSRYRSSSNSQPHIMIYFKTSPPDSIYNIDNDQIEKIKRFRQSIRKEGLYTWDFKNTEDIRTPLLTHLAMLVRDKFSEQNKIITNEKTSEQSKYEKLANKIDSDIEEPEGIIELIDKTNCYFRSVEKTILKITAVIKTLEINIKNRTKKINIIKAISENRIKQKKKLAVIKLLSNDLSYYSDSLSQLLPEFKKEFNPSFEAFSKLILVTSNSGIFIEQIEKHVETLVPDLKGLINEALESISKFLNQFSVLPEITSEFAVSKKRAEKTTNELFKEFIKADKLLDEIQSNF